MNTLLAKLTSNPVLGAVTGTIVTQSIPLEAHLDSSHTAFLPFAGKAT
jgi:hypothetical protein